MRFEFHRPDEPDSSVGVATWDGALVLVSAEDPAIEQALARIFRPTPVVVDDASYRTKGTTGEVVVQPGSLVWFRAAAQARSSEAGLIARLVPGVREGGFDPAAQYRRFDEAIERLAFAADP